MPTFPADEVHVWSIDLNSSLSASQSGRLSSVLSESEHARADRFHFERDRQAFIRSHGALRILVSKYLGMNAGEIQFTTTGHGKPEILAGQNPGNLCFNLSHTRGIAVIGFAWKHSVGIDVESREREIRNAGAIAKRFFTPRENRLLATLHGAENQNAFFRIWTQKEAYLKATGEGLSSSLSKVEVAVPAEEPVGILEIHGSADAARHWNSWSLHLPDPFTGTVTSNGTGLSMREFHFNIE